MKAQQAQQIAKPLSRSMDARRPAVRGFAHAAGPFQQKNTAAPHGAPGTGIINELAV
jgi:hypothetical protein